MNELFRFTRILILALAAGLVSTACAQAITYSDSNIRPDGGTESSSGVYMVPSDEGQVVYGQAGSGDSSSGSESSDAFDSTGPES